MKIKACVIGGNFELHNFLSSSSFSLQVLTKVVQNVLKVENAVKRPAEYYLQNADVGPAPTEGMIGVEVRMTGISRDGRPASAFHQALRVLEQVVSETVIFALSSGTRCQIFCVLMLDGEIESSPGSGMYTSVLEGKPFWVDETGEAPEPTP